MTNVHPFKPNQLRGQIRRETIYPNIFCYGDACITRADEIKTYEAIKQTALIVAHNLIELSAGTAKLETMPYAIDTFMDVSLSNWSGFSVLNDYTMSTMFASSKKEAAQRAHLSHLKKGRCNKYTYGWYSYKRACTFACMNYLCCCLCSKKGTARKRREELKIIFNDSECDN